MGSINFEFLLEEETELQRLGSFAEQYAYSDPESAVVKLRTFTEHLARSIYFKRRYAHVGTSLMELLQGEEFTQATPPVVLTKFHAIRKEGNKAAHGAGVQTKTVLWLINEAHQLARWYSVRFLGTAVGDLPVFREVPRGDDTSLPDTELLKELEGLAEQHKSLMDNYEAAQQELAALKADNEAGQQTADSLHMSEAETRKRLIDVALAKVGWDIGQDGQSTGEVGQEVQIKHTVKDLDSGFVDYVLYDDDGLPLAVIEAKKTSKSAEIGKKQASLYASALEAEHGRRPVIMYTNGYDIFIWDDVQGYPPRQIFDFYSKDSLQRLVNFQRTERLPLDSLSPNPEIAGRTYQIEAIRRVTEKFEKKFRKGLIVMATGTGKTRVAVSLTDLLMRAKWAKRVLFLCDRKELRKQAKNAYTDLTDYSVTIGGKKDADKETARIMVATYPGMMNKFAQFDPGHFDLIIADESHRSIYNMYRDLFRYFDCFQIGLTATPVGFINKNTFTMFECEKDNPTAYYPLERAVEENYLVPYEVFTHTTQFLRDGIKYSQLSDEQKAELEDDGEPPEGINFESQNVDKEVLNKDTNRLIIRNLMDNGIKDGTNQQIGKSVIFARNHNHAVLLEKVFNELYPQYGGKFCQVIDSHDPRADQLIDDFKGDGENDDLTLAVSVDMLDTGIDVPEIVNLVFAKPVKSKVKFWQMIGRGTRLCDDLFAPGKDKQQFRIFDHWDNFAYFEQQKPEAQPTQSKAIRERLFEIRMALAHLCLEKNHKKNFKLLTGLIEGDVRSLPGDSISVREKWQAVQSVLPDGVVGAFAPNTVATLSNDIAPLMRWVDTRGHGMAYSFDLLVSFAQLALFKGDGRFEDYRDEIISLVANLQTVLPQVRARMDMVTRVKSQEFWTDVAFEDLEEARKALRDIIKHQHETGGRKAGPKIIDISEDGNLIHMEQRSSNIRSIDMKVYRKLVEEALERLFDKDPTLQKIRRGEPVTEAELTQLSSLVLTRNPGVKLELLTEFFPELAGHLDLVIRSIVGLEKSAVEAAFSDFVHSHPTLTADQLRFLDMLKNQIAQNGQIRLAQLITEQPFTTLHPEGIDGVFGDDEVNELMRIVRRFEFPVAEGKAN